MKGRLEVRVRVYGEDGALAKVYGLDTVEVDDPDRHSRLVLQQLAHLIDAGEVQGLEPGQPGFEREATVH